MAPPAVGQPVIVAPGAASLRGICRYVGTTAFAPGEWIGVELDEPRGKNDGAVNGKRYFQCGDKRGVFVKEPALKLASEASPAAPAAANGRSPQAAGPAARSKAGAKAE